MVVWLDDPGQGFHRLPPLTLALACGRHLSEVVELARFSAAPGEDPAVFPADWVAEIVERFHDGAWSGRSEAISVLTPGRHA